MVANDKCDPYVPTALNLLPKRAKCTPSTQTTQSSNSPSGAAPGAGPIIGIVFCLLVIAGILVAFLYWRHKTKIQRFIPVQMFPVEESNTALDEDLLQGKEAESLDDEALKATVNKNLKDPSNVNNTNDDFNPRA